MNYHRIIAHVEGDIGHMEKVIGEIFLDQITFVTSTDHKIIYPMGTVNFQDMPQDWAAANLYHWLGL